MTLAKKISLREGETISLIKNQHWIVSGFRFLLASIILIATSFLSSWFLRHDWWGKIILISGMGGGLLLFFRTWLLYVGNALVITAERTIRIRRRGWFDELITSVYFDDIYDVTFRRPGLFGKLFNYGTIVLRGQESNCALEIPAVPDPRVVTEIILDQRALVRTQASTVDGRAVYGLFLSKIPQFSEYELRAAREAIDRQLEADNDFAERG